MPISASPAELVPESPAAGAATPAAQGSRGAVTGVLLRFITCGLLSIATGLAWKFTLAPSQVNVGSALLGIGCLLFGFVIGGILWYLHDARLRSHHPERVSDEHIVFSFIVFALVPFAVLALVILVWLIALVIGAS